MNNTRKIVLIFIFVATPLCSCFASSSRHHFINMGKNLAGIVTKPVGGIFVEGPKSVKKMYQYEVYEREDPSKRGLFRYKLFAFWSAPAIEIKSVIDGLVGGIASAGGFLKEFLSIPFSD